MKALEEFSIDFSEYLLALVFSFVCSLMEGPRAAPEPELQLDENCSSEGSELGGCKNFHLRTFRLTL